MILRNSASMNNLIFRLFIDAEFLKIIFCIFIAIFGYDFEKLSIDEQFDIQIELDYEIEQALFNNIKNSIKDKHLKLFVVIRENPYWFVLPDNSDKNQKIIDAFNQVFPDGGDTKLMMY